jgi:hypothetical protein
LSGQSEVKIDKVPWISIILLTLVFGFIGPVQASILPNASWYALGSIGCKFLLLVMPLLYIMAASLLAKLVGRRISATTYTYLYAAGIPLIVFAGSQAFPVGGVGFVEAIFERTSQAIYPWPSFFAPPAEIVEPMVSGSFSIPLDYWAAWLPTFAWYWLLFASCAVFMLGWGIMWRRHWIEVENVPFPQTRVAIELVNRVTGTERSLKARLGLNFVIGMILGIVFQLPLLLTYLFPWFPDIYGWKTNTCTMGSQWITTDSPLIGIVGLNMFNKDPALGAMLYMAPLNILFGIWFWYLIYVILMQVSYTMGYFTGITGVAGCGRDWCSTVGYDYTEWYTFTSAGVTTGIFISYIILNRKYLVEILKAASSKLSREKLAEFDKTEPTSYMNACIMIAGSAILIIAVFMAADLRLSAAILMVITFTIVTFVETRAYSLVGFVVPAGGNFFNGPIKTLLGGGVGGTTTEYLVSLNYTYVVAIEPIVGGGVGFPLASSLAAYQMASVNRVSVRNVFKILLFVSIMAPLVSMIGAVWGFYTFGVTRMPTSVGRWRPVSDYYLPSVTPPFNDLWLPFLLGGIAFAGFLSFMHARFIWFPFEPIGFLLAMDGHAILEGIWTMALSAWVLKTITLRVGGSKLYEQKGIPTAIGFIIGIVMITIIGGIFLVTRFFVPF